MITPGVGLSIKGKVDPKVEKIMIEPHVLHVSAEAITPELLAREEKMLEKQEQQEKRRKEKLERMAKRMENNNSATSSRSSSIDDYVDDSDIKTSSASTSRSATPTLKNGLPLRNGFIDVKGKLSKRKNVQLLSSSEAKKPRLNNDSKDPSKLEMKSQTFSIQDTVLIRLRSGQIVRVPKSLLKRVSIASGSNSLGEKSLPHHNNVIPVSMISSENSTHNQLKTHTNLSKNSKVSIPNTWSADQYTPVSTPFECCLSDALEKLSPHTTNCDENSDSHQKTVLNGILEKLSDFTANGRNSAVQTVKIRAYQGNKNVNITPKSIQKDFGVAKLSQQLQKVEQKLTTNVQRAVQIPNLGVSKGSQQTIMMSGGGNVTRVVIPKWLNVSVAPSSGSQTNVVAVSPTKQTQNIIRIRGPLPARTHTQQNSTLSLGSEKSIITAGSSLLKDDGKSSQMSSNVLQKVPVPNTTPLKLITTGATRTIYADLNSVLKQQQNPQQLRVLHHQQPFLINNVANSSAVVNTLFKDTSGSPIVIKKSLVSSNSLAPSTGPTLLNITNNKSILASSHKTTSDISKLSVPTDRNNVVIVENVNSSSKETTNSFYKSPILELRQKAAQSKSSVPAVVMVSKVDHTANPKIETGTAATSVISSSNPVQGEVEFYDKEL